MRLENRSESVMVIVAKWARASDLSGLGCSSNTVSYGLLVNKKPPSERAHKIKNNFKCGILHQACVAANICSTRSLRAFAKSLCKVSTELPGDISPSK